MKNNLSTMVKTDLRRMGRSRLFYILVACALLIPVVMVVMMSMMDGTVTVDPQTGAESVMEGPENAWQSIGTLPSPDGSTAPMGGMDVMAMCNINMMYFLAAVLVCIFVAADFRSGYAKNLFAVRSKKSDYIISKSLVGFVGGALMIVGFFVGAMLGGAISGLPFDTGVAGVNGIVMCMLAKVLLIAVFTPIYLLMSVIAKEKLWLSLIGSLMIGMLFFMMIPVLTPLDSTIMNVILCLAGGVLFNLGFGAISQLILKKKDIL